MPPLLPDEATKAQETFRLGDRFYVEEHGLVLGELIGIEKIKKTVTTTLEGSIIYSGGIGYNSYIVSCNDGGMSFNLTIISNSGNIHYNIINGMIRQGYSIYVDGDKNQYLKIKRDETVIDKDFNFTFFRVI